MVQSIYLLAVLVMGCVMASTSADGEDKAQAETDAERSLQLPQQVLSSSEELRDHQTPPQRPEILVQVHNVITPMPTELAIYQGPQAVVTTKELDVTLWDVSFWGQSLGEALELAKIKAKEMDLKQVAIDIEAWVEKHPWKASFYAASALGFFAPEIFSIPALEALGFGVAGVRAGSVAAKIQSTIGPIAARSVFAIWQSARMGGYGVANVNGGVRAVIALADAAAAKCDLFKDCKGLVSDAGPRLRSATSTTALAVVCGCVIGFQLVF